MRISKTNLSHENWISKYQYKTETELETQKRIAKGLASVEKNPKEWEEKFLNTLVKFSKNGTPLGYKCTPGGRITANIGTDYKKATALNCFINGPVSDAKISYTRKSTDQEYDVNYSTTSSPDDLTNIFLTIMEQAKTLASEGGYGINFDFIRPRGSIIKGIGIKHPGVVAYMKIWDAVSECIVKGDNDGYTDTIKDYLSDEAAEELKDNIKKMARKGAMMGCLSVEHPDIEEFVRAKQEPGNLTKFNISVVMNKKFMTAVENDEFYELKFNKKTIKRIKAKDLYDLIMESTYNRAEPGVLFEDNMDANNPISYLGKMNATNPCGEIGGNPWLTTVCLLGSINLTMYVDKYTRNFDWDAYATDIKIFARMLDNVCDVSTVPLESYQWALENIRQYGMGINGLGSTMLMLGIKYGSEESKEFASKIFSLKENLTLQTSALLAQEKGSFPAYDADKFQATKYFKSDRITDETRDMIRKYGIRNAKTTTNPPLGNSSVLCDNISNGIEPIFSLEYERKMIVSDWPKGLNRSNVKIILGHFTENDFEYWRGKYNNKEYYYEPHNRGLCEVSKIRDYGYQWLLDNYPDEKKLDYVVTTADLNIDAHLDIQELAQFYCNQSISKTCNIPNKYDFEDFKRLYLDAWKRGLNGFTTYREGSMESVLSTIVEKRETKRIIKRDIKLPDQFLNGPTTIIKREGTKFYLNFSYLPSDIELEFPVAMWIYTNKLKGQALACNKAVRALRNLAIDCGVPAAHVDSAYEKTKEDDHHNKLARMISLNLRHNVPYEEILFSLTDIEEDNVSTLLTAVRKFLASLIADGTHVKSMSCPECKGNSVKIESGCFTCTDCGFAGCG